MRAGIVWAAIAALWSVFYGSALAQEENTVLEGAKKFCAAEYGERLLGVTLDGEDGFACRFAAVEKIATYKLAPEEPAPKWDLDEEAEAEAATAAVAAKAAAAAKLKRKRAKLRKKRRYKRAKLRKRRKQLRRQKALRAKKRDPFAAFMRKVRKATSKKKRSRVKRKRKRHGFTF